MLHDNLTGNHFLADRWSALTGPVRAWVQVFGADTDPVGQFDHSQPLASVAVTGSPADGF